MNKEQLVEGIAQEAYYNGADSAWSLMLARMSGFESVTAWERKLQMSQEQKILEAAEKTKKVIVEDFAGKPLHVYRQDSNHLTLVDGKWAWKPTLWVNADDIKAHCGTSKLRLKHCVARMKNNTFEYKDTKRQKKIKHNNKAVYSVKVKEVKGVYWITARCIADVVKYIVSDFATRRPYLPEARKWWKQINSDCRIRTNLGEAENELQAV